MSISQVCDPKQALAISYYKDPKSETFGDLKNSLLRAGYSETYADRGFSDVKWIQNIKNTVDYIQNAERNLQKVIKKDINIDDEDNLSKSKIELLKMQLDSSKFVLKTLASSKYNEEKEQAKQNIQINITKYGDDVKEVQAEIVE